MSSTISRNLLKFMSIESVMLSNHLIFCHFSFCLQSFPASGSFPTNRLFNIRYPKNIGASALASVPPMNIQGWFPLGSTGLISLLSKETWRVFSTSAIWKHQFFGSQSSLWSNIHTCTWVTEKPSLTIQTFVGKVMSLFFNTLIEVQLIYNTMLISSVEHSDSVIHIFFRFSSIIDYYKI